MFSNKSSRASSIHSLFSSGGDSNPPEHFEINADINAGINTIQNDENDGDNYDLPTGSNPNTVQLSVTQSHPMGRILLSLLRDSANLAKKSNLKEMESDINELCSNFYNSVRLEKAKSLKQRKQVIADVEASLIDKELNSHMLNLDSDPPTYFSPVPTLLNAHQRAEAMKLFPGRNNKFSGQPSKDHGMDISEFLSTIKLAQEQCGLSESEFKGILLGSTTGKAHSLLKEWISDNDSVHTIFHNFLIHFDRRSTPEECKQQLFVYKAPKTSNLARVEAHIMSLAGRASILLPAGISRTNAKNVEMIQTLIRSLPPTSSATVQSIYNSLSARLGRAATANELSRALNNYRHIIDNDIRQNGVDMYKRMKTVPNTTARNKKFTSYAVSPAVPQPNYRAYNTQMRSSNPNNGRSFASNSYGRGTGNNNFSRPKGQQNFKPKFQQNGNRSNRPTFGNNANRSPVNKTAYSKYNSMPRNSTDYCSLCGKRDHVSSNGCPHMVSDSGVLIGIMPTHGTCTLCPSRINPRLNHPPQFCPFRKGGPLANSS